MDDALEELVGNQGRGGSRRRDACSISCCRSSSSPSISRPRRMVRATVPLHDSVTSIPGFFDFTHVRNTGAAFGILDAADFPFKTVADRRDRDRRADRRRHVRGEPGAPSARGAHRPRADHRRRGRQPDRPRAAGSVVDFVDVYWRTYHFWAFNVADSAISVGVAIMILDMLGRTGPHVSKTV